MKTFKKALFVGMLSLLMIFAFAFAETSPSITVYTTSTATQNSSTESLDAGSYNFNSSTSAWYEAWATVELWNADTSTKVATLTPYTLNPDDTDVTLSAGNYYIKVTVTSGKGDNVSCYAGLSW